MRGPDFEWGALGGQLHRLESVDSTNSYIRRQAELGAPHGLAAVAGEQTGGRGRFGREFQSARGKGLYLSLLLRPDLSPAEVMELTPRAAVAVCRAVERVTGLSPAIKWINDILLYGKKLCGILTEAELSPEGTLRYVVLGIGLNITQCAEDFTPEVAAVATSLAQQMDRPPTGEVLLTELLRELNAMWDAFSQRKEEDLEEYRRRCITVGREVDIHSPAGTRRGFALGVEEDFSLLVRLEGGALQSLGSGEVSVRSVN